MSYEGTTILASGSPDNPVRFSSAAGLIIAQDVRLDTQTQQLQASGTVQFERERQITRQQIRPRRAASVAREETFRETAFGQNLIYDFKTGQGTLDSANLRLSTLTIDAQSLVINGQNYSARNVVLRPGGLTEAEEKIYGVPPFNLRAREIVRRRSNATAKRANASRCAVAGFTSKARVFCPSRPTRFIRAVPKVTGRA